MPLLKRKYSVVTTEGVEVIEVPEAIIRKVGNDAYRACALHALHLLENEGYPSMLSYLRGWAQVPPGASLPDEDRSES